MYINFRVNAQFLIHSNKNYDGVILQFDSEFDTQRTVLLVNKANSVCDLTDALDKINETISRYAG